MSDHQTESGDRRVTDLSAGSGMHFTDPLPRRWPDNAGRRRLCVCTKWEMCMAHATQRDAAERLASSTGPTAAPTTEEDA